MKKMLDIQGKLGTIMVVLSLGGLLIFFASEGISSLREPVFGSAYLTGTSPIVVEQLERWNIHTVPSWGNRKIAFENGQEFVEMPPREFLREHPHLSKYRVVDLDTPAQFGAFIAYRLLQKYNEHNEEMNITHLSQIKKLLDAPHFMEGFIRFLHLQLTMITLTSLENAIVDASREREGLTPQGGLYPAKLEFSHPIRKDNRAVLKKIGEEADLAWKEIIRIRNHIL